MLKYLLSLLPLFFYSSIRGQTTPFPTPGMEYGSIYVCNPFDCATYTNNSMRYSGDTVLCGETWNSFKLLPNLSNAIFVRAEMGKYYRLYNCANQVLLYDFSKNIGDTILTGDLGALKVIDQGIFFSGNGGLRKKLVLQSFDPFNPQTYTWVDGIGDINRGFLRPSDFEGGYGQLICLRDSSGMIYQNPSPAFSADCNSLLCPWPRPAFDYSCENMTYYFTNLSKESDSYLWDFGDGESSTEPQPSHTFANPGCYTVYLKAKSDCLPQEFSTSKKIAVNAPFFWQKSLDQVPATFKKMQFLDPEHGWALSDQKIWKTSDGGIHWDSVPYPGPMRPVADLHFKDFEHGIVQIYKPGPPYYYSDILWTNNGTDWETQTFGIGGNPSVTAIERINDSVAVVGAHYQNLFLTKNWGQTWEKIQLSWLASLITDFEHIGGDTVYFIGTNQFPWPNSTTVFGKTYDLQQWTVQEFPGHNYGEILSFTSSVEGWMSNKSSVYHTTDGGQSWTKQLATGITEVEFTDSLHGWASGYSGVFGTIDGGITWEEQACARAGGYIRGLNVFAPGHACILFEDGLYRYKDTPDTIKLCLTSNTAEPDTKQGKLYSIFPNPSSDLIKIQWNGPKPAEVSFVLYSIQGLELLRWTYMETEQISLSRVPEGIYFLEAYYQDGSRWARAVEKLLVVR